MTRSEESSDIDPYEVLDPEAIRLALQVGPPPGLTPEELLMKVATATMRVHHQLCARLMADGCTAEEADRIARSRSLQIKDGRIAQEREANRWKG